MEKFKTCCKEEIKKIWKDNGGSMNVVSYTGECKSCGSFIGLTQTSKKEAEEFLNKK